MASACVMDGITPPSTVLAADNHDAGPKEIRVWRDNRHDGAPVFQLVETLGFPRALWG